MKEYYDAAMDRRDFLRLGALAGAGACLLSFAQPLAALAAGTDPKSPAFLPATELIRMFKAGTLSPADVLLAQIERIKEFNGPLNTTGDEPKDHMAFNGKVNCITYEHFETAMKAANESEKRYKAGRERPLEGLTVAIKDESDVRGWRTTMGSLLLKDSPLAEENAAIIDMLLDAGAVLHVQTTVPEFYSHGATWSRLWGVTRNPWNLRYSVGGSSGGSGAALAAGFTTLATGSDMGGSIRLPSSLCGVYGFKPPFGRVPTSETSYETMGPMARNFGDLVLMQNAITGPHPKVLSALRPKLEYPVSYSPVKGVKVALAYFEEWIPEGIEPAVRDSLTRAAQVLRGQGAVVKEVKLGWTHAEIFDVFMKGLLATEIGNLGLLSSTFDQDKLTPYAKDFFKAAAQTGPAEAAQANALATKLHRLLQSAVFNAGYSAMIMPTLTTTYYTADNDPTKDAAIVNGKSVTGLKFALTPIWNLLSRYPIVNVPIGIAPNNVPIGMQVIGNTFDDLGAFQVAAGYAQSGLHLYQGDLFPAYINKA